MLHIEIISIEVSAILLNVDYLNKANNLCRYALFYNSKR